MTLNKTSLLTIFHTVHSRLGMGGAKKFGQQSHKVENFFKDLHNHCSQ